MLWLNSVCMMGKIITDVAVFHYEETEDKPELFFVDFILLNVQDWKGRNKSSATRLICKAFGMQAKMMVRRGLQRGDYLLIKGQWRNRGLRERRGKGGKDKQDYLLVELWQGLHPPPNQFRTGHAMVPIDELRRLKALTAHVQDMEVPRETLERYGLTVEDDHGSAQPDDGGE